MNQTKKRRRFIASDDSSSSSDGSDCVPISINRTDSIQVPVLRTSSHLKLVQSVSKNSVSVPTTLPFIGSKSSNIIKNMNHQKEEEPKNYDDVSSVDTAELLQSILQPKHQLLSEKMPNDLDDKSFEIDTASSGVKVTSTHKSTDIVHRNDDDSVETAELVRRIREPLDCDLTLSVTTNLANDAVQTQIRCESICFSTNVDNSTTNCDTILPRNNKEIKVYETSGKGVYGSHNEDEDSGKGHNRDLTVHEDDDFFLPEQCDDEFVLPEESDTDSSDDDSSDPNENGKYAYTASAESYRCLLNTCRDAPKINGSTRTEDVQTSMKERPLFECGRYAQSIENEVFGFEGSLCTSKIHTLASSNNCDRQSDDVYQFDCNHDARQGGTPSCAKENIYVGRLQNSRHGKDTGYQLKTNSTGALNDENIECFSDDECAQAFGFGKVAKNELERRQFANRLDRHVTRSDTKSLSQRCITTSSGQFALGRCPESSTKLKIKKNISTTCKNGKSCVLVDSRHDTSRMTGVENDRNSMDEQKVRSTDSTHEVTKVQDINRPRRIRDPTSRPIYDSYKTSTVTSAQQFRLHTATHARSATTINWERNDVYGGSGVGAGSYQMHKQPYLDRQTIAEGVSVIDVDSSNQSDSVVSKKRRTASKTRSFKKARADGGSNVKSKKASRSGSRGGGRRGKWGWKSKGKKATKEKSTASSQHSQHRNGSTWAGNTDDPQLRHVGGAEMSF